MGGNALKNTKTRRYQAAEYHELEAVVRYQLTYLLGTVVSAIPAYRDKESFGNMDLLVASNMLSPTWKQQVIDHFKPTETYSNGNVFSFDYKELQIDLIVEAADNMLPARNYFAYNDLGNLMGRIAHSMHMRLGHHGLSYEWRDPDNATQVQAKRLITQDWAVVCQLLDLDFDTYDKGFATLESIFQFVASSVFFNPTIYLLENRNNVSRVRDQKRKTYMQFLQWCERNSEWLPRAPKPTANWTVQYLAANVKGFADMNAEVLRNAADTKEFKARFNGVRVAEITGLTTQGLGQFMNWLNQRHPELKRHILVMNPNVVPSWVEYQFQTYSKETS